MNNFSWCSHCFLERQTLLLSLLGALRRLNVLLKIEINRRCRFGLWQFVLLMNTRNKDLGESCSKKAKNLTLEHFNYLI